jgi:hypothetical protein
MDRSQALSQEATVRVLWRFTDHLGRFTVCRLIERRVHSTLKLRVDHNGYAVITETHPNMEAIERRSREYYNCALAEGWIEVPDGATG